MIIFSYIFIKCLLFLKNFNIYHRKPGKINLKKGKATGKPGISDCYNTGMSLLSSVDIGSNSIRLLIAEYTQGTLTRIVTERRVTRLGNSVGHTGKLLDAEMEKTLAALAEFSTLLAQRGIMRVRAVATSAVRDASNAGVFLNKVRDHTGLDIEVVTGEAEAALTLKGVMCSLPGANVNSPPSVFIVDIGGGSTECVLYSGGEETPLMRSLPLGLIALSRKFIGEGPMTEDLISAMEGAIAPVIDAIADSFGTRLRKTSCFVGAAGTFSTIASIDLGLEEYEGEKIHLHRVSRPALLRMFSLLSSLDLQDRMKVRGLEASRADLIMPGVLFTINLMNRFDFTELTVSDWGLLEGVLIEMGESLGDGISKAG
jgi:exopolyphosphatase / guanosine-5'-triphosphate,3'-diphosphate pyrophosphatase